MSKAKWKNFTLTQIQEFVEQSRSFRQLAQFLGYSPDGGSSIATVRKMVEELQLDTSHFTGMAWNKIILTMNGSKTGEQLRQITLYEHLLNCEVIIANAVN